MSDPRGKPRAQPAKRTDGFRLALIALVFGVSITHADDEATREPPPPQVLRRFYRMQRNLPYGFITTIAPAGRHVWFGGWSLRPGEFEGIARYDRETEQWRIFRDTDQMLADEIDVIAVDGERLWIGGKSDAPWNRGLHQFHPESRRSRRLLPEEHGIPHWRVRDIHVREDEVWLATLGGVARWCRHSDEWDVYTAREGHLSSDFTTCIVADDVRVWVGTAEGTDMLDRRSGRWRTFNPGNSPFPSPAIDIGLDDHTVWFVAPPSIVRQDRASGRLSRLPIPDRRVADSAIKALAVAGDVVFFGSSAGLHAYSIADETWRSYTQADGMLYDDVMTLAADEREVWCVDSLGRGVSRLDRLRERWEHHFHRENAPSNHIYDLAVVDGFVYLGTLGGGLWRYDPSRDRWSSLNITLREDGKPFHYLGDKSQVMYSDIRRLAVAGRRIWLATQFGLCLHDSANPDVDLEVISSERFPMLDVAVFQGRVLCAGQMHGLRVYDPQRARWHDIAETTGMTGRIAALVVGEADIFLARGEHVYRLSDLQGVAERIPVDSQGPVQALLVADGVLWVGTADGLWRHDLEKGVGKPVAKGVLPHPSVRRLAFARGRYWVGTEGGMASCLSPDGDWLQYEAPDTLGHPYVSAIAGGDRFLWIGTMGGGLTRLMGRDSQAPPEAPAGF